MLEHNGKSYARVSDILKPFINFGDISEDILNRKAAIGTRIHEAIHQEIQGNLPIVSFAEKGYFQSFEKWRINLIPTFIESEMRCYCDEKMLTGCIDALVKLKGEKEAILIDWKTSVAESPITWPMQAHLYHYLLIKSGKTVGSRFLFIKLDKNGDMPKVFQYKFDSNLMRKCLQALDDFWKQKNVATNLQ